jgi:hypothetical protein
VHHLDALFFYWDLQTKKFLKKGVVEEMFTKLQKTLHACY